MIVKISPTANFCIYNYQRMIGSEAKQKKSIHAHKMAYQNNTAEYFEDVPMNTDTKPLELETTGEAEEIANMHHDNNLHEDTKGSVTEIVQESTTDHDADEMRVYVSETDEKIQHSSVNISERLDTDYVSVISSSESASSWIELNFQMHADAIRFSCFVKLCVIFVCMYTIGASTVFYSSFYPVREDNTTKVPLSSSVDAFLLTSAIITVDITSAFFVVVGFFCAYTMANINASDVFLMWKVVLLNTWIDVFLANFISVLFGSIFHLCRHSFHPRDVMLTIFEGVTCLRVLELSQSPLSVHTLNPTAWPVLCLVYSFILTPWTMVGNDRLRQCHPRAGASLLLINAIMPILTISLFALLREDTNFFFMNSTHMGYRLLEFNLGICFFTCMQAYPLATTKFTHVVKYIYKLVLALFLFVWWGQLGTPVQPSYNTCIRMYYFSPCIQVHNGFLMRGCVLGITLLCHIVTIKEETNSHLDTGTNRAQSHGSLLASSLSAVVLIWPICYIVHLILEINFSLAVVHDNAALLVLTVPVITWGTALLWNNTWKVRVFNVTEMLVDKILLCLQSRWNKTKFITKPQGPK